MPVGFGFGVGDFIATINLFKDVAVALKDHGGARDDYNKSLSRLETTSAVLSCLETLESPTSNVATLNAIRGLAHVMRKDVDDFLTRIEKYRVKLLPSRGTKKIVSRAVAKVKWSQFVAAEVIKLHQDIQIHVGSLDLLLSLHNIHASSSVAEQQGITQALLIDSNKSNQNANTTTLKSVESGFSDVNAHLDHLDAKSTRRDDQIILDIARKHEELKTLVANVGHKPKHSQGIMLVLTIPQLNLSSKDIASISRYLAEEIEKVLKLFFASCMFYLKGLLLAIPQIVLIYRVLNRLPQAISLVLHDNITFEDALGRVQSLQYEQFKHWDVFEASLGCTFEQLPGMQKVIGGQYILMSTRYADQILTAKTWSAGVRPGMAIKMAMLFNSLAGREGRCPRKCNGDAKQLNSIEYQCRSCGLTFALSTHARIRLTSKAIFANTYKDVTKPLTQREAMDLSSLDRITEAQENVRRRRKERKELTVFKHVALGAQKYRRDDDTTARVELFCDDTDDEMRRKKRARKKLARIERKYERILSRLCLDIT